MADLVKRGLELIAYTSTDLSKEVEDALRAARRREEEGTPAKSVLGAIIENVELARQNRIPICQDTGLPAFYAKVPDWITREEVRHALTEAVRQATLQGLLRPNAVDSVTGKNSGDGTGEGLPMFHFERSSGSELVVDLLLKGGGSENVSAQYRLPDPRLQAGRDLLGVEKCVLDAVYQAQGFGCAPAGTVGICIGGDRAHSYLHAKRQLLRRLGDTNPDPTLAELEQTLYRKLNQLEIGPMGFGGRTTVLGVKVASLHRHPASFFVSVAYACWAHRHRRLVMKDGEYRIE